MNAKPEPKTLIKLLNSNPEPIIQNILFFGKGRIQANIRTMLEVFKIDDDDSTLDKTLDEHYRVKLSIRYGNIRMMHGHGLRVYVVRIYDDYGNFLNIKLARSYSYDLHLRGNNTKKYAESNQEWRYIYTKEENNRKLYENELFMLHPPILALSCNKEIQHHLPEQYQAHNKRRQLKHIYSLITTPKDVKRDKPMRIKGDASISRRKRVQAEIDKRIRYREKSRK